MNRLTEIAADYVGHASADYVGLWQIASRIRSDFSLESNIEVHKKTIKVVRYLLTRGLLPGDYTKNGFEFWVQKDSDSIIDRIDSKWALLVGDPSLAEPICWFARRPA